MIDLTLILESCLLLPHLIEECALDWIATIILIEALVHTGEGLVLPKIAHTK